MAEDLVFQAPDIKVKETPKEYESQKASIFSDPKRYLLDKDIDKPGQLLPYIQNEQAFLMDFMAFTHNKVDKSKFQKNLITVLQDESNEQFINKACTVDGFEELFSLNSSQKARLLPTIRIYKQFYKGNIITDEEEFVFDNFTDLSNIQQITQDRLFRGAACGIKNLKIDSDAKNPATGQFVVASLDLLFNDVQQIFSDTTLPNGKQISYSDLFSYPLKENDSFFQIKMLVGWNGTEDVFERLNIQYCKMILQLNLRSYSIDLREDGQAVLKIEYNGAIENILYDGQSSNLIKISKSAQDKLEETKTKLKIYEDTQKKTEKKIDEIVKSENQDSKVFGVTVQSKEEKRAKKEKKASKIIDPVDVTMGDNAAYFYGKIQLHATDVKHQLVLHMLCTAEMYKEQQTDGDNEMPALNADADFKTIATLYHFVHAVEQGL